MKRGFTLIELLAILAILAIIALITTPIVLNIIGDVNKNAFAENANSLVTAIRNYQNSGDNFGKVIEIDLKTESKKPEAEQILNLDGDYPDAGMVGIDADSKVSLAIWDDDLQICVYKSLEAKEVQTIDAEESSINKSTCLSRYENPNV